MLSILKNKKALAGEAAQEIAGIFIIAFIIVLMIVLSFVLGGIIPKSHVKTLSDDISVKTSDYCFIASRLQQTINVEYGGMRTVSGADLARLAKFNENAASAFLQELQFKKEQSALTFLVPSNVTLYVTKK